MLSKKRLDLIFSALSDPTRRGILEQLADGVSNITQLGARYKMSQPAISKHLKVLERAGLVRRNLKGREHYIAVNTEPLSEAHRWLEFYSQQWETQFDSVDQYLKKAKSKDYEHKD